MSTNPTPAPETHAPAHPDGDTNGSRAAQVAADQRIAALRSQLAMVQAERSLLHARTATDSGPPAARGGHGPGGWIFAGLSFVFFLSMVVFAATRPPTVRVVEVEVTREVRVPVEAPAVAVVDTAEAPPTVEPEATRARVRPRPGTGSSTPRVTTMGMGPRIDIDGCGGDPLCGS